MYLLSMNNAKRGDIKVQTDDPLKQIDSFLCVFFFRADCTRSPYFMNNFDYS